MKSVGGSILITLYKLLRKLAKSQKYQTIYGQCKESGVSLFKNKADYTEFQLGFLQYLSFYASLHMDIYLNEVDEIVLDNEVYEDAYYHYKNKVKSKERKDTHKEYNKQKKLKASDKKTAKVSDTHVVFSKPRV